MAVLSSFILSLPTPAAEPGKDALAGTLVIRSGKSPVEAVLKDTPELVGIEQYCQNGQCIVLPRSGAELEALRALEKAGEVELEPFPDARRIYFAKATYDADAGAFDAQFHGSAEVGGPSALGQWAVILKAFLSPAWQKDFENAGFFLGDSLGPVAYQLFGLTEALQALLTRVPYIAATVPIPHGIKRFRVDEPLPGDEDGASAPTTVAIFALEESPARTLLERREGLPLSVVYTSKKTVAYRASLTRDEALYLSTFPDVVAVMRETATASPSDERSNRIIAGAFQDPSSSWPLSLTPNTSPPFWNGYLASLASIGIHPENQTIGFLDSGVGLSPMLTCPPALVDPTSGKCSLTLYDNGGVDLRSIADVVEEFGDPALRGNDYLSHGTLTTAIAAGFATLVRSRDDEQYSMSQGVAPGAKIAMSRTLVGLGLSCIPDSTPPQFKSYRRFPNMPGGGYLFYDDLKVRYSLAVLSQPVNPDILAPDGVMGAGATLFNHSWNLPSISDYGPVDIILDKSARTLSSVTFDFGPDHDHPNVLTGPAVPATHVVSAGNTDTSSNPTMVTSPGTAKNVITVGATESYNQLPPTSYPVGCRAGELADADNPRQIAILSRFGYPNNRLKPDIVAPGTRVFAPFSEAYNTSESCIGKLACYSAVGTVKRPHIITSGTSFAAPAVTGVVALLREWFGVLGKPVPSPAMIRATLIVGAQNLVEFRSAWGACHDANGGQWWCGDMRPAPDQYQGWGGVSLARYFSPASNYFFHDQENDTILCQDCSGPGSQPWTTTLTINDSSKVVRLAVAWTDAAGTEVLAPFDNLKNDLDLEVRATGSDGIPHVWYGNVFYSNRDDLARTENSLRDPASPVSRDRKNNQEKAAIAPVGQPNGLPAGATTLTITVRAFNLTENGLIPDDPARRQDFAIAVENAH
ncbi:MAG: S8 family serine peptidase [Holophagales bacterium]|nr:S8 family serine peptidase [Holophagales bacterium]